MQASFPLQPAFVVFLCSLLAACVAPIRVPTKTTGPRGGIDLGFLQVGSTRREEVVQKLGWANSGVTEERIFLGRWASSSWDVIGGVPPVVGESRAWTVHNLLVQFDEHGVVQGYKVFSDADLVKELTAWIARGQSRSLDLTTPISISIEHRHAWGQGKDDAPASFMLAKDGLTFSEPYYKEMLFGWRNHDFKLSLEKISSSTLTLESGVRYSTKDLNYVYGTIHFHEKTRAGSKLTARMDIQAMMALVQYLEQSRRGSDGNSY